jgi:cytochrome c biogenesis protein CcmG/thiol:disulfide interchange protein DsbE
MSATVGRRRILLAAPLAGAAALGVGFWKMLGGMEHGSFDPHDIHAPALDRPVPDFTLPDQPPGPGFSSADLRALHAPVIVNFFASWCIPCVAEMPVMLDLAKRVPIWGIAYKDKPENAAGFLARAGNPYSRVASDLPGVAALDWGISGVPESFVIGPGGVIRWHNAAPLTDDLIVDTLMPLIDSLRA